MHRRYFTPSLSALLLGLGFCLTAAARNQQPEIPLTEQGQQFLATYSGMQDALNKKVTAALPPIAPQKKAAFIAARATEAALQAPDETADAAARTAYEEAKTQAEAAAIAATLSLLADSPLPGDTLDSDLMKAAILRNATPRGLAEFAQQGPTQAALLDTLFGDEALMKQMLVAGGANGGEFGEAMEVYTAILAKSERAREVGSIFQRLALGTALQQPWLDGKPAGGVHGIVRTDHQTPDGQIARYLHYEEAYLAGELDPQFKDFNTWECRFITNDPYTNEELAWVRQMLRNFRPDHITRTDQTWRYTRIVKSDVPYCSTTHDDSLGLPQQQAIALGGICGRRAFFGRFVARAFGIPCRRSTSRGHAAMNRWTPDGWVNNLGAWWSHNWCGPQGGLDFYLDSQAREHEAEYLQVLRAQWVGDALGEDDISLRQYGQGGGFWDSLAFTQKRAIVNAANQEKKEAEAALAALSAEEARLLGESDEAIGGRAVQEIDIPEADRTIVVGKDGIISIPAAACDRPTNSTDKVVFMESWGGGTQIHYARLGNRPELIRYTVEVPADGKYNLVAKVATVAPKQEIILRLNRRTLIDVPLPYTKGMMQESEPMTIELREGRNTLMFTCRAPNRGVTIKEFTLTPVK